MDEVKRLVSISSKAIIEILYRALEEEKMLGMTMDVGEHLGISSVYDPGGGAPKVKVTAMIKLEVHTNG